MEISKILEPWVTPIIIFFSFTILFGICRYIVLWLLRYLVELLPINSDNDIAGALSNPLRFIIIILGLFFALKASPLSTATEHIVFIRIVTSCIIFTVYWILFNLSSSTNDLFLKLVNRFGFQIDSSLSNLLSTFSHFVLACLCFAMIVSEWGFDISGFVAGLSLGGLAISLAAKDALSNIFAGMVILADKPFTTGDRISCNGVEGTVEKISFRSTSIRTLPQALVYMPNSILTNTAITNFTNRNKRKIEITLGVTYSTTREQMQELIKKIEDSLIANTHVFNDDISVAFTKMADSSLNIVIICYTNSTEYNQYAKVVEGINLDIMRILEEVGASAAFPSSSIYMETPIKYETK